jgi:hypothetical protein
MGFHVEQAELEHGEQPAGTCADDEHVGLDGFGHLCLMFCAAARTAPDFSSACV